MVLELLSVSNVNPRNFLAMNYQQLLEDSIYSLYFSAHAKSFRDSTSSEMAGFHLEHLTTNRWNRFFNGSYAFLVPPWPRAGYSLHTRFLNRDNCFWHSWNTFLLIINDFLFAFTLTIACLVCICNECHRIDFLFQYSNNAFSHRDFALYE